MRGRHERNCPRQLAVVNADNCTGCEACIEVCPVDCIYKVPGDELPSLQSFVDIDLERCIGCDLCERWCPWDAIDMVEPTEIAEAVAEKGGPAEYVEKNWDKLVAVAQSIQDLAFEQQAAARRRSNPGHRIRGARSGKRGVRFALASRFGLPSFWAGGRFASVRADG